jgi:activating signal cointegrator 1
MTATITLPALTVRQPWASLISAGAKAIETRSWPPPAHLIGECLAIHAARAALPRDLPPSEVAAISDSLRLPERQWTSLPFGAVICTVTLAGAYRVGEPTRATTDFTFAATLQGSPPTNRLRLDSREQHFGDFQSGQWLWLLTNVQLLAEPRPAIGQQGLWRWMDGE